MEGQRIPYLLLLSHSCFFLSFFATVTVSGVNLFDLKFIVCGSYSSKLFAILFGFLQTLFSLRYL